jgi:hypothetical protein
VCQVVTGALDDTIAHVQSQVATPPACGLVYSDDCYACEWRLGGYSKL